jgi:nicotinate-nucleotide adenylyltransferase
MGEDNLKGLKKWKNWELLVKNHQIIVYPRMSFEKDENTSDILTHPNIHLVQAPIIELSATEIRDMLKNGRNIRPMLPPEVFEYLDGSSFYR